MDPWAINHSSSVRGAAPRVLCSASRSMRSSAITGSVSQIEGWRMPPTAKKYSRLLTLINVANDSPNLAVLTRLMCGALV